MSLSPALTIVKKLKEKGHTAYFAGGWVRDLIMKHPSDDIDIATSATPEELQSLFPKTIPVGIAFGILLVIEGGHSFEVATFRTDKLYLDGRRPTGYDRATPEEDAKRRDFTINGLFYDPLEERIIDYVKGQKDIQARLIRAIGNPDDRFKEDRLRMVRAIRYSTRFSFAIEERTWEAIAKHSQEILPAVAIERIWQEFKKMSRFSHFDRGLLLLHELKLLGRIFPKLACLSEKEMKKRVQHFPHFPKNVPPILEILELFPKTTLEEIDALCDLLKLSSEERALAFAMHRIESLLSMPSEWQERLEPIEWAQFYAAPHTDLCLEVIFCKQEESKKKELQNQHQARKEKLKSAILRLQEKKPLITSLDLLKRGISPGPQMGRLLKEAERIAVNEDIQDKELVLEKLQKTPLWLP